MDFFLQAAFGGLEKLCASVRSAFGAPHNYLRVKNLLRGGGQNAPRRGGFWLPYHPEAGRVRPPPHKAVFRKNNDEKVDRSETPHYEQKKWAQPAKKVHFLLRAAFGGH